MTARPRASCSAQRPELTEVAKATFFAWLTYAGVTLAGAFVAKNALMAVALQALFAEWGAGRMAVAWNDPRCPVPGTSRVAQVTAQGVALGLGLTTLAVALVLLGGAATLSVAPAPWQALVGLWPAALAAVRDELLLHGMLIRVFSGALPVRALMVGGGLASAAAGLGDPSSSLMQALVAGLAGACFTSLWLRDRGAWRAVGAHAGWLWGSGTLARGALLDVHARPGWWAGGDRGPAAAPATALLLLVVAAVGYALIERDAQRSFRA